MERPSNTDFGRRLLASMAYLRKYAHTLTKDKDLIDDIVQETLLKALSKKETYRKDENLNGWLVTIMRNTYYNFYLVEQRYTRLSFYKECCCEVYKDTGIEYKDIAKLIAKLPPELAVPLNMYANGYKYSEIANNLSIPMGTVKTRIHIARNFLKLLLRRL